MIVEMSLPYMRYRDCSFPHFLSLAATRETSFVHAISAAGVMYTLTRNCSLGDLDNCGCDVSNNGKIGEVFHQTNMHYASLVVCTQIVFKGYDISIL